MEKKDLIAAIERDILWSQKEKSYQDDSHETKYWDGYKDALVYVKELVKKLES